MSTVGPLAPEEGSSLHPGSERYVVNLHGHDKQRVTPLMDPILPALTYVMSYDPWLTYESWVILCDVI
jgi:hypothetical protein